MKPQQAGATASRSPLAEAPDPVREELDWIDRELRQPIVIPSDNARQRRERLRRERARLEKLL